MYEQETAGWVSCARRRVVPGGTGPVMVKDPVTAPSECAPVTPATRETTVAHLPVQGPRNAQVRPYKSYTDAEVWFCSQIKEYFY